MGDATLFLEKLVIRVCKISVGVCKYIFKKKIIIKLTKFFFLYIKYFLFGKSGGSNEPPENSVAPPM